MRLQTQVAPLPLHHVAAMSDGRGLFEHAKADQPRLEHGYCTDDVARGLTAMVREPEQSDVTRRLAEVYLRFVEEAVAPDGAVHNRMNVEGRWTDRPDTGDWWGRAIAGLGAVVRFSDNDALRVRALAAFERAAQQRSGFVRSSAFAAVGAAHVLMAMPEHRAARYLVLDCLEVLPQQPAPGWGWIEPRLRYANATLAEALIRAGTVLSHSTIRDRGLAALEALCLIETAPEGWLSLTGVDGRRPGQWGVQFDQQPIEANAIAEAALAAWYVTGDDHWGREVERAWAWFLGSNDAGIVMIDPEAGAGFDGLKPEGRNENRGAESTLAALATNQCMRILAEGLRR